MAEGKKTTERFASEEALIDYLRSDRKCSRIGDDAAFLPATELAVTMDTQLEGRHFLPGLPADMLARRALAVNLSDLAAVGAEPRFVFIALVAPKEFDFKLFFDAVLAVCGAHPRLELAGGDLTSGSNISVTITLTGERRRGADWLRRTTARADQNLWIGGSIGEAALGLALIERFGMAKALAPDRLPIQTPLRKIAETAIRRQLAPSPQLELGAWLAEFAPTSAAIDVSDGLTKDLHRMCTASHVSCAVELDALPVRDSVKRLYRVLAIDWQETAISGGEDYVLLFSLDHSIQPPRHFGAHKIGYFRTCEQEPTVELSTPSGSRPLSARGWDHFER